MLHNLRMPHNFGTPHSPCPRAAWRALVVLFAFCALLGEGCSSSRAKESANSAGEGPDGPALDNMVARIYNDAELETVVQATRGVLDMTRHEATLSSVVVSMRSKGEQTGEFRGDKGVLYLADRPGTDIAKNDFVLVGNVRYKGKSGNAITAPQVRYRAEEGKFVSGGNGFQEWIKVEGGYLLCTGKWFETNKDLTEFSANENARLRKVAQGPGF